MRNKSRLLTTLVLSVASIIVLLGVTLPSNAHADSVLPDVHILNLGINSTSYTAGGLITGSFTIINDDSVFAPNITYVVDLAGGYTNGLPTIRYDEKVLGTVSLNSGQSETIPFTYTIPATVSGTDLGIRIQAETQSGLNVGWQDDDPITITDGQNSADIIGAWLSIGKNVFLPDAGPSIYSGQSISYNITLENPGTTALSFTPHLTFYDMTTNSSPIQTLNEPAVSLKAGQTKTFSYTLPNFDYKPLVYAGQIVFPDANGNNVVPTRDFKYIISGPIATVQSVLTPSTNLVKGQHFSAVLTYTGEPLNITTDQTPDGGMATATVSIYNQQNQVVALANQPITLNDASITPVTLSLVASGPASTATVKVVIYNNSGTLTTYNAQLFKGGPVPRVYYPSPLAITLALLILIIILYLVSRLWKKWPRSRLASMIFFVLVASAVTFIRPIKAFVVVEIGEWNYVTTGSPLSLQWYVSATYPQNQQYLDSYYDNAVNGDVPILFINAPSTTLGTGQNFTLAGSAEYEACGNHGAILNVSASFNGSATSTATTTITTYNDPTDSFNDYDDDFSLGTSSPAFVTPSIGGAYQVNIEARRYNWLDYTELGDDHYYFADGYQPVQVGGAVPTVNLIASPNQLNPGASTTLTWTSTYATSCTGQNFQTNGATNNATIGTTTPALFTSTTYQIVCSGPGGYATSTAPVTVDPLSSNTGAAEIVGGTGSNGSGPAPAGFESYVDSSNPTYANPAYFSNVAPETGPTANLAGWWQFNDGSGTSAADSSGNDDVGTLVGGPTWVAGENGDALTFSGSNQYVSANAPPQITFEGAMSVSLWLKYSSVSTRQIAFSLVSDDTSSYDAGLDIELTGGDPSSIAAVVGNGGSEWEGGYSYSAVSVAAPTTGAWHHVVYVQDGQGNAYLYVDGNQVSQGYTDESGSTGILRIGGFNDAENSNDWNGSIDDVRVYDTALSPGDVDAIYNGQAASVTANVANIYEYNITADACTYPVGGTECTPSTVPPSIPVAVTCTSSWCTASSTLSTDTVTKFGFEYSAAPTGTLIIHGVGSDNTTGTAPPGSAFENYITNSPAIYPATTQNPMSYNPVLPPTAITNGLVGFWSFNDGSGTTIADSSGNSENGVLSGAGSTPAANPVWIQGQAGGALSFNNNSPSFVRIDNTLPALNAFTSCAFVEGDPSIEQGYILSRADQQYGVNQQELEYNEDGNYPDQWSDSIGNYFTFSSTNVPLFVPGQWHQVCFSYGESGNVGQFYWDGQPVPTVEDADVSDTSAYNTPPSYLADESFYIGGYGNSGGGQGWWSGGIDDVRLYDRQLSDQDIQNIYQADSNQVLAYGSYIPGYSITADVCATGSSGCPSNSGFSTTSLWCNASWCAVAPPISSTETTNVYFKYQKLSQITGNIEVEGVGPSLAPIPSFQSFITGTSTSSANPATFSGISTSISNSLFNTGVDDSGNPLLAGINDEHWTWQAGTEAPTPAITSNSGGVDYGGGNSGTGGVFISPGPGSEWVAPWVGANGNPLMAAFGNTNYYYTTTFKLSPNQDLNSVVLNGEYSGYLYLQDILLNGESTGINDTSKTGNGGQDAGGDGDSYNAFSISSSSPSGAAGFNEGLNGNGLNTLTFVFHDNQVAYGAHTGLDVSFNQATTTTYAYALNITGDDPISYGTCSYTIGSTDCTPTNPNTGDPYFPYTADCTVDGGHWCAAIATSSPGKVTKVEFYYSPPANTGDIDVETVDSSGATLTNSSQPALSSIETSIDGAPGTSSPDLAAPSTNHAASSNIPSGYTAEVGYYQYLRTSTDPGAGAVLTANGGGSHAGEAYGWSGWQTAECSGTGSATDPDACAISNLPASYDTTTSTGYVTAVVFQYLPPSTSGCILTPNYSHPHIGQTVTFTITWPGGPAIDNTNNYIWSSNPDTIDSGTMGNNEYSTSTAYSSPGPKSVSVTIMPSGGGNSCTTPAATPYVDFNSSFLEL